jgi:hypothetical protein
MATKLIEAEAEAAPVVTSVLCALPVDEAVTVVAGASSDGGVTGTTAAGPVLPVVG